jgi:macrodomain Ter protein organizer (MatP/YcbG family)
MIYGNIVITDIDDNNKYDLLEHLTPNCKSGYLCKEIQSDTDIDQLMDNMECNPNVVLHIYSEKNPEEVAAVTERELSKSMSVMFSDKNEDYA